MSLSVFFNGDLIDESTLVLPEEKVGGLGEAVGHVADVEMGLALFVISLQAMLAERPFQMMGGGLGRSTRVTFLPMYQLIISLSRG